MIKQHFQQLLPCDLCFLLVPKFGVVWFIVDLTMTVQSSSQFAPEGEEKTIKANENNDSESKKTAQ